MFNRAELVLRLTLSVICDDYENLTVSIERDLERRGRSCGIEMERSEIVAALEQLIHRGWAKAYWLSPKAAPAAIDGMPPLDKLDGEEGAWFCATREGKQTHRARWEFWPFDDDDQLRKDWTPPSDA